MIRQNDSEYGETSSKMPNIRMDMPAGEFEALLGRAREDTSVLIIGGGDGGASYL